jgi:serine/threonine protein kinase
MTRQPQAEHPTADTLAAFALGHLDEIAAAGVADHLAGCESCQRAVRAVPDDSMVALLRPATGSNTPLPVAESQAGTAPVIETDVPPELHDHARYRVLQRLGAGGMGVVYKAEHRLMARTVALKVISKQLTEVPGVVERFRREVQAAARLSHSNLVQAHDAEQAGELHFLVTEFVDGQSLAWLVDRDGPLSVEKACDCVRQAAVGLAHALERGLVHRDVKPQNLMLTPQGLVKVLDFGLASIAAEQGGSKGLTEVGQGMGTPDYMAPEQIRDAHSVDTRADVYSLGCTLYFLLTGQPPFPEGNSSQKMAAHLEKQPTPVQQLRPGLPAGLVKVVERMMAKAPARRYQTPAEVVAALEPFCRPAPAPQRRRSRLGWVAAAAVLVVALAGLLWWALPPLRVETEYGTLEISTEDPDVEIVVKHQGKVVQILHPKSKRTFELRTGAYELELSENGRDLELSSNQFTLTRDGKKIAVVKGIPKQPSPSDPRVLTVSQKPADGGRFRTITEALDKVEPGMTIRVLDDAIYEEYLQINRRERYRGVILEAAGKASLRRLLENRQAVHIDGVPDFTLLGFRFESVQDREPHCQVSITGRCPGVVLDRLDIKSAFDCVDLYGVPLTGQDAPLVIQNCTMRGRNAGVRIEGTDRNNVDRPLPCGHIVLRDNILVECGDALWLIGALNKVHVVGNRVLGSRFNAITLLDPLPGTGDVLVANNTLLRCRAAVVVKDDQSKGKDFLKCKNIRIQNNLVLEPEQVVDLWFLDHDRGNNQQPGRRGDLQALLKSPQWRFSHNWRELTPLNPKDKDAAYWIPASPTDRLQVPIEVLSRTLGDPDFLQPAKESPLAKGGAGGSLPAYVGAVPPQGTDSWDWDETWKALLREPEVPPKAKP